MEVTKRTDLWTFAVVITALQLALMSILQILFYPPEMQPYIFAREPVLTLVISMPICLYIGSKMHEVWLQKQAAERRASLDGLTELSTREAFLSDLSRRVDAYGVSLMVDIDHFKNVNDTYGHLTGDDAIRHVAEILRANTRTDDLICRFGGEEFVIFLHRATMEQGREIAERMRGCVETAPVPAEMGTIDVTISVGGSLKEVTEDVESAIAAADAALYEAKEKGRNRVVMFPFDRRKPPELTKAET